jgi:hypothetical protein
MDPLVACRSGRGSWQFQTRSSDDDNAEASEIEYSCFFALFCFLSLPLLDLFFISKKVLLGSFGT